VHAGRLEAPDTPGFAGSDFRRGGRGRRIGVLGGTFDPVHIGHLVVAVEARYQLDLDHVLLVVANDPWQKRQAGPVAGAADRLAVVAAAVENVVGVEASSIEIDRGGPSYSVETLEHLAGQDPEASLFLIVGADVAGGLGSWHRCEELPTLATLVVAHRAGSPLPDRVPGFDMVELPIPDLAISSSDLRQRLRTGRPVDFLIPEPAVDCMAQRGLYLDGRGLYAGER
jgi:nicotinate-nucleotide adenylyltransferase